MLRLVPHQNQSAPVSPLSVAPLTQTGVYVSRVRRASRSTDGTEPGEGAVSAGYLAPSANPSAPARGGAASKPGPDRSKERMSFLKSRINGSLGFSVMSFEPMMPPKKHDGINGETFRLVF